MASADEFRCIELYTNKPLQRWLHGERSVVAVRYESYIQGVPVQEWGTVYWRVMHSDNDSTEVDVGRVVRPLSARTVSAWAPVALQGLEARPDRAAQAAAEPVRMRSSTNHLAGGLPADRYSQRSHGEG